MRSASALALVIVALLSSATAVQAREPSSTQELRRRVWQLERTVLDLQDQVDRLTERGRPLPASWTCHMQSFGKTFVSDGPTRASAMAEILKKCSDDVSATHCQERDVKCDDK